MVLYLEHPLFVPHGRHKGWVLQKRMELFNTDTFRSAKQNLNKEKVMGEQVSVQLLLRKALHHYHHTYKYDRARALFARAAATGDTLAQYEYAVYLEDNACNAEEEQLSMQLLISAAKKGLSRAQVLLGQRYEYGIFVRRNVGIAFLWYRRAAAHGSRIGAYMLGICYHFGIGVDKNDTAAEYWWRKALRRADSSMKVLMEVNGYLGWLDDRAVAHYRNYRYYPAA